MPLTLGIERHLPPDSACFPGTRGGAIKAITCWADTRIVPMGSTTTAHVYWFHGFAGSGKSAISLEIAKIYAGSGRLLASYFFFRNAGDRSRMNRFAVTLASQLAAAVPSAASFIEAAIDTEPGLLTQGVSLTTQMERLVYHPFQAAVRRGLILTTLLKGPFLIVIDGLDECEDKQGIEEFITHMLDFFKRYPSIPLRVFIASRVEQHIHAHLKADGVLLGNLDDYSPDEDIDAFLQASFRIAVKQDPVIQAYIHEHGNWPTISDMGKLNRHINGSFVLASTIFKFIVQPATEADPTTPMDRLPLTLEMNGLDDLYAQILARSQHLPHSREIISTIALLLRPLPIVGISTLLGIKAFEVIRVLLNLQAIIHVPGIDEEGDITLCHTSLRDFLTIKSRSGLFFVPPSFHLHLSYYCFSTIFSTPEGRPHDYGSQYFKAHRRSFVQLSEARDFLKEIGQFKGGQPQLVDRLPYHAFLCSMLFSMLFLVKPQPLDDSSYLLTECTKQLALAVECSDYRIQLWLEKDIPYFIVTEPTRTFQLTEHAYKALQHDLQRASTAILAHLPRILGRQAFSTRKEKEFVIASLLITGISIFTVRQLLNL
ncbi:hypothetical protein H1R20_g13345, partial [Candolleomyces eurysporus]